jgi:hypothetical protein
MAKSQKKPGGLRPIIIIVVLMWHYCIRTTNEVFHTLLYQMFTHPTSLIGHMRGQTRKITPLHFPAPEQRPGVAFLF